jgi:hypothetical protein
VYNPNFDPLAYEQSSYEFHGPGLGWQQFVDYGFNIYLETGRYTLRVVFDGGSVNLCSAGVAFMAQWAIGEYELPITYNALHFDDAMDADPNLYRGNCKLETLFNGVDAKATAGVDDQCLKTGPCYLALTRPGEWVRYDFSTEVHFDEPRELPTGPVVSVTVRVASSTKKRIILELDGNRKTVQTPGKGYTVFEDIRWENIQLRNTFYHPLYVVFKDGSVNMCSVKVAKQV